MNFLTYILLAVSASAVVVDPQAQGRWMVGRNIEQQVEAPKARDLAFEVRHANERRKNNATANAIEARKASNSTAKFITVRKSSNATAKAMRRASKASNNTARAVRDDGRAHLV
ncbi:hypothetical protein SUNI508_08283 [Seiridium unicorne]|uniref:Uncharacterized protein n=1 Tax=Seiridium unicorne TaxID=138068 RepID=A0ABR2UUM9_9PEZI